MLCLLRQDNKHLYIHNYDHKIPFRQVAIHGNIAKNACIRIIFLNTHVVCYLDRLCLIVEEMFSSSLVHVQTYPLAIK